MADKTKEIDQTADEQTNENAGNDRQEHEIDSKYRLILLAAQRTKQLQRGAQPRVDADPRHLKNTRIAMEEIRKRKVNFEFTNDK